MSRQAGPPPGWAVWWLRPVFMLFWLLQSPPRLPSATHPEPRAVFRKHPGGRGRVFVFLGGAIAGPGAWAGNAASKPARELSPPAEKHPRWCMFFFKSKKHGPGPALVSAGCRLCRLTGAIRMWRLRAPSPGGHALGRGRGCGGTCRWGTADARPLEPWSSATGCWLSWGVHVCTCVCPGSGSGDQCSGRSGASVLAEP